MSLKNSDKLLAVLIVVCINTNSVFPAVVYSSSYNTNNSNGYLQQTSPNWYNVNDSKKGFDEFYDKDKQMVYRYKNKKLVEVEDLTKKIVTVYDPSGKETVYSIAADGKRIPIDSLNRSKNTVIVPQPPSRSVSEVPTGVPAPSKSVSGNPNTINSPVTNNTEQPSSRSQLEPVTIQPSVNSSKASLSSEQPRLALAPDTKEVNSMSLRQPTIPLQKTSVPVEKNVNSVETLQLAPKAVVNNNKNEIKTPAETRTIVAPDSSNASQQMPIRIAMVSSIPAPEIPVIKDFGQIKETNRLPAEKVISSVVNVGNVSRATVEKYSSGQLNNISEPKILISKNITMPGNYKIEKELKGTDIPVKNNVEVIKSVAEKEPVKVKNVSKAVFVMQVILMKTMSAVGIAKKYVMSSIVNPAKTALKTIIKTAGYMANKIVQIKEVNNLVKKSSGILKKSMSMPVIKAAKALKKSASDVLNKLRAILLAVSEKMGKPISRAISSGVANKNVSVKNIDVDAVKMISPLSGNIAGDVIVEKIPENATLKKVNRTTVNFIDNRVVNTLKNVFKSHEKINAVKMIKNIASKFLGKKVYLEKKKMSGASMIDLSLKIIIEPLNRTDELFEGIINLLKNNVFIAFKIKEIVKQQKNIDLVIDRGRIFSLISKNHDKLDQSGPAEKAGFPTSFDSQNKFNKWIGNSPEWNGSLNYGKRYEGGQPENIQNNIRLRSDIKTEFDINIIDYPGYRFSTSQLRAIYSLLKSYPEESKSRIRNIYPSPETTPAKQSSGLFIIKISK